ncbi:MAG TPA: ribose-phosphate diphosphokinase [Verrucomicrobia bacterium]|nr:MAG: ribose-phosphate pyrophosphokinase [Lentisphaerae bacterium GWF2_57_35]HBA85050.1 ribose-phosphate diphosphokinase [Verrucomicrobiota bacterium]
MRIFSGNANRPLAEKIAAYLNQPLGDVAISRFPDGEVFVKIIDNIRGKDVFIVQPTCFPPNETLMELLIMIDAARRASAARITAVIPFYGYARQDRKDQPRVPITAKLVANLLVAAGANRLLTMDLHAQQIQGFFDIPVDHLHAAPVIVKYLQQKNLNDVVVVSPDPGGLKMTYAYSNMLQAGLAIVAKQRRSATEVEAINLVGDVKDCNALLVDDLTTTAGTLCEAAKLVKKHGAKSIVAAVSHAPITLKGIERLKQSDISELVTTDSIPPQDWKGFPVHILSVAELLGEAILRIHNDQSVSSLFKIQ